MTLDGELVVKNVLMVLLALSFMPLTAQTQLRPMAPVGVNASLSLSGLSMLEDLAELPAGVDPQLLTAEALAAHFARRHIKVRGGGSLRNLPDGNLLIVEPHCSAEQAEDPDPYVLWYCMDSQGLCWTGCNFAPYNAYAQPSATRPNPNLPAGILGGRVSGGCACSRTTGGLQMPTFQMVTDDAISTESTSSGTTITLIDHDADTFLASSPGAQLVEEARQSESMLNNSSHAVKITYDSGTNALTGIENITTHA